MTLNVLWPLHRRGGALAAAGEGREEGGEDAFRADLTGIDAERHSVED